MFLKPGQRANPTKRCLLPVFGKHSCVQQTEAESYSCMQERRHITYISKRIGVQILSLGIHHYHNQMGESPSFIKIIIDGFHRCCGGRKGGNPLISIAGSTFSPCRFLRFFPMTLFRSCKSHRWPRMGQVKSDWGRDDPACGFQLYKYSNMIVIWFVRKWQLFSVFRFQYLSIDTISTPCFSSSLERPLNSNLVSSHQTANRIPATPSSLSTFGVANLTSLKAISSKDLGFIMLSFSSGPLTKGWNLGTGFLKGLPACMCSICYTIVEFLSQQHGLTFIWY